MDNAKDSYDGIVYDIRDVIEIDGSLSDKYIYVLQQMNSKVLIRNLSF